MRADAESFEGRMLCFAHSHRPGAANSQCDVPTLCIEDALRRKLGGGWGMALEPNGCTLGCDDDVRRSASQHAYRPLHALGYSHVLTPTWETSNPIG